MNGELKFSYKCQFCGKEIRMSTRDIIQFIGKRYGTPDGDQLESFFDEFGKEFNLCPECARSEGFEDCEDYEGW